MKRIILEFKLRFALKIEDYFSYSFGEKIPILLLNKINIVELPTQHKFIYFFTQPLCLSKLRTKSQIHCLA